MKIRTNRSFYDIENDVYRKVGDEFEVSNERFDELNKKVKGFVSRIDTNISKQSEDKGYDNLTIAEIKERLDKAGIEYDKNAKKDDLKALLK